MSNCIEENDRKERDYRWDNFKGTSIEENKYCW
jgi:hypothetical protein